MSAFGGKPDMTSVDAKAKFCRGFVTACGWRALCPRYPLWANGRHEDKSNDVRYSTKSRRHVTQAECVLEVKRTWREAV
jgi:hypothetical protein